MIRKPPFAWTVTLSGAVLAAVSAAAVQDPTVVVIDPVETAPPRESTVVTAETLAYWDYRDLLDRVPVPKGESIGGPGMVGMTVGGRSNLRSRRVGEEVKEILQDWDGWGAAVLDVMAGSPAEAAWLQPGDVIVRYSGIWVDTSDMLIRLATRTSPNREVEVWYFRDGQVYQTWVVPGSRDEVTAGASGPIQPIEDLVLEGGRKGVVMPRLVDDAVPEYPSPARRVGAGGTGKFRVVIGTDGEVQEVSVLNSTGREDLDEAALAALELRAYEPGRVQGRPVAVSVNVVVIFSPDGPPVLTPDSAAPREKAESPLAGQQPPGR